MPDSPTDTPDRTDRQPFLDLSLPQLVAGATAAATSAILISHLDLLGTVLGAACASVVSAVVTAGLADVARVVPMVIWANVGTSVLVLLSAIDISHAVLFLLGVTGIAYYFDVDKAPRLRHLFGALLGLGQRGRVRGVGRRDLVQALAQQPADAGAHHGVGHHAALGPFEGQIRHRHRRLLPRAIRSLSACTARTAKRITRRL